MAAFHLDQSRLAWASSKVRGLLSGWLISCIKDITCSAVEQVKASGSRGSMGMSITVWLLTLAFLTIGGSRG